MLGTLRGGTAQQESFRSALDACAEMLDPLLEKPLLDEEHKELLDLTKYPGAHPLNPLDEELQLGQSQRRRHIHRWYRTGDVEGQGHRASGSAWTQRWPLVLHAVGAAHGEYAAAVCCGILELEDAVRLVAARGQLMEEHCEANLGGMTACALDAPGAGFAPEEDTEVKKAIAALEEGQDQVAVGRLDLVDTVVKATGAGSKAGPMMGYQCGIADLRSCQQDDQE
eukprot:Skav210429  [mRNA]  locus=scaffold1573:454655:459605:+ [translate_table: standard]